MTDSARQLSAAYRTLARTERELRTEEMARNTLAARHRLRALRGETRSLRRELIQAKREMRRQRSLMKTNAWSLEPADRRRMKTLLRASKLESAACKRSIQDAGRILTVITARLRDWKSEL
jgi:hypothetical protein